MLAGCAPFSNCKDDYNAPDRILQKINVGALDLISGDWRYISSNGRDLLKCMLTVEAKKRIKIDQVLAHTWIKNRQRLPLARPQQPQKMDSNSICQLDKSRPDDMQIVRNYVMRMFKKLHSREFELTSISCSKIAKRRAMRREEKKLNAQQHSCGRITSN